MPSHILTGNVDRVGPGIDVPLRDMREEALFFPVSGSVPAGTDGQTGASPFTGILESSTPRPLSFPTRPLESWNHRPLDSFPPLTELGRALTPFRREIKRACRSLHALS